MPTLSILATRSPAVVGFPPRTIWRSAKLRRGDRRLKKTTRDMMWTSQKTSDGKSTGYGYAFSTGTVAGVAEVSHGGSQQGTSTYIIIVPERRARSC
jgi:hypothetical protein